MQNIYVNFFKLPSDVIPYGHEKGIAQVRAGLLIPEWWKVYNFIDFLTASAHTSFIERVSSFWSEQSPIPHYKRPIGTDH